MPFTKQERSSGNILCYQITGVVTESDYKDNLIPETNKIISEHGDVRMLCDVVDFRIADMEWTAMWEDAKFGIDKSKYMTRFALICKHTALANAMKPFFIGTEFRVFSPTQKKEAYDWIFEGTEHVDSGPIDISKTAEAGSVDIPFFHTTKFLVAIGEGAACNNAIGHALNLLRGDGTDEELHLVTVFPHGGCEMEKDRLVKLLENAVNEVEGALGPRSFEARMTLRVSRHLIELTKSQSIADCIVELANKLGIDYIVMGTEHATQAALASLFHPSVAKGVLKGSPCPVIFVQPHQVAKV